MVRVVVCEDGDGLVRSKGGEGSHVLVRVVCECAHGIGEGKSSVRVHKITWGGIQHMSKQSNMGCGQQSHDLPVSLLHTCTLPPSPPAITSPPQGERVQPHLAPRRVSRPWYSQHTLSLRREKRGGHLELRLPAMVDLHSEV